MTALNFLFRKPRLPIIIHTGAGLLGAKSWATCAKRLASSAFQDTAVRQVIDANGEGFSLHPEHLAFSPLTFKKRWTKTAIIALYNELKSPGQPEYPTISLGNKNLEKVVKDIVELLEAQKKGDGANVLSK